MNPRALDQLPGFRRRFRITPGPHWVTSEVEDDYHCMSVTLRHDGRVVTAVEPVMHRAPWTTCPGAVVQLQQTFTGIALDGFVARGDKTSNCTHLHDLALLAAAHARDAEGLVYDILVSDPVRSVQELRNRVAGNSADPVRSVQELRNRVAGKSADPIDGHSLAELRRNGATLLAWTCAAFTILDPPELAGTRFDALRPWIDSLDAAHAEAARLLRWGSILAHGRTRAIDQQSDARRLPVGSCYTFQPERVPHAQRIVDVRDFSRGDLEPLGQLPPPQTTAASVVAMDRRTAA